MRLYLDEYLKEPVDKINFGEVEAGKSKVVTMFLYNDSEYDIKDVRIDCNEDTVKIKEQPMFLPARKATKISLEWSPKLNVRKALAIDLSVKGFEVIKPRFD